MLNRYVSEQAEIRHFIACLNAICDKPYRTQQDYADAIDDALKKDTIPFFLIELCATVRELSRARSYASSSPDMDPPTLSQAFISIVSELSGVSTSANKDQTTINQYSTVETQNVNSNGVSEDRRDSHERYPAPHMAYAENPYRGFIDGV